MTYTINCKATYEAVQAEYAHIGRLTEMHFKKNIYTREFYNKKVDEALQRIANIEEQAIARIKASQ